MEDIEVRKSIAALDKGTITKLAYTSKLVDYPIEQLNEWFCVLASQLCKAGEYDMSMEVTQRLKNLHDLIDLVNLVSAECSKRMCDVPENPAPIEVKPKTSSTNPAPPILEVPKVDIPKVEPAEVKIPEKYVPKVETPKKYAPNVEPAEVQVLEPTMPKEETTELVPPNVEQPKMENLRVGEPIKKSGDNYKVRRSKANVVDINPLYEGRFAGKTPEKFTVQGATIKTTVWADMLYKLCEILYDKDSYTFIFGVAGNPNFHGKDAIYISRNPLDLTHPRKLKNGNIYVGSSETPFEILGVVVKLLEALIFLIRILRYTYTSYAMRVGIRPNI